MAKVLVVEDMPDSAEIATQILRIYGHSVLWAKSGEEGLAMSVEHQPDLILYDYWLPDIEARTFLRRLREATYPQHIKVVVCTAAPEAAMAQQADELQFDGWIAKPYRLSVFMQVIEQQLI